MRTIVAICMFLVGSVVTMSQTAADLFNENNETTITWLGIDFYNVKLIGSFNEFAADGQRDVDVIRDRFFPQWNSLILQEQDKYNLRLMLRRSEIQYDIEMISRRNAETPIDELAAFSATPFSQEDIQRFVSQYTMKDGEGIGVLFIAEYLNKDLVEACFHFVAINMTTQEVLVHERLIGKPGGFGLRNYWARSYYNIMLDITKKQYPRWKKKYQ